MARLSGTAPPPANMAAILRHNLGELEAPTIAPRELQALREQASGPFVLDVRSALEFEAARIEGARRWTCWRGASGRSATVHAWRSCRPSSNGSALSRTCAP